MEIKFEELHVDKEDAYVSYNDELHKYWTKDTKQSCISATTLIHLFETFDEDFWSSYKALERILGEDKFKSIKSDLTLHKNVKKLDSVRIKLEISDEEFKSAKDDILEEWKEKREKSCIRGSTIHKELELGHLSGNTKELQHLKLGGSFKTDTSNQIKLGDKGVYPELLLSRVSADGKLRIAGQADLVIIDGNDVYILDYKTSKEITKNAFFDRRTKKKSMMKYPLNNIEDTNFWHYSLQLSLYAWMIQKINPEFNIKLLMLIHYDHDGGCTNHECQYLKDDVERMLAYYKKQMEYEEFKSVRKKITH